MPRKETYTAAVRAAVTARDDGACRRCGRRNMFMSRHHRKPRKMGGANRADAGRLSNVVTLCGSATTPGGCHLWVEENRDTAREQGWLLYDYADPQEVPLQDVHGRWFYLHDDGSTAPQQPSGAR